MAELPGRQVAGCVAMSGSVDERVILAVGDSADANAQRPEGDQAGTNIVMCLRGNAPVRVRAHTALRGERIDVAQFAIVPDLDMVGARGAGIAARTIVLGD